MTINLSNAPGEVPEIIVNSLVSASSITIKPSGDTDDYFTLATASDIPTITATGATHLAFGSDISLGANKLLFNTVRLSEIGSDELGLVNLAGTAYKRFFASEVAANSRFNMWGNGVSLDAPSYDDNYGLLKARDTGVGLIEIARMAGAADPYFGIGVDGSVLKGTNAGLLSFYGATPVAKPSAYTQTYVTADKTHAAETSADFPAGGTGAAAGAWDTAANRDLAITRFNALRVDVADLKQLVNSIIDDFQALGLVG